VPERADPSRDRFRADLARTVESIREALSGAHEAREAALPACRRAIRASGSAIRAVHRLEPERAAELTGEAEAALRRAQEVLGPFPAVAHAGFLHDAEKEYAEARFTAALVAGDPLPRPDEVGVATPAWLRGLAEAASELRRHALDRLRAGELDEAEGLLGVMDDVYDALMTIDLPDAITAGLRRTVDALRAVLERTRGDVTTTAVQARLQRAIEQA
jgi:translin